MQLRKFLTKLVVLTMLVFGVGCQIMPGHWRPGWNSAQMDEERPSTAASWKMTEQELGDGRFLALTISGGGSRAANFGAAVMLELDRLGVLEQVDVISSISWGGLPAIYYGLGPTAGPFDEQTLLEKMGADFFSSFIRRSMTPGNIFRSWFTDWRKSDDFVNVLNNQLFHKSTFADLRSHPKVLISATILNDNTRFTFTDDRFKSLHSTLANYEVANAIAASSAFPGLFAPVTLQNYAAEPVRYLHLYDGAILDNLGIQTILEYLNRNLPGRPMDRLFPKGCMIIIIDASPVPEHSELDDKQSNSSFVDYFVETGSYDVMEALLLQLRQSLLSLLGMPNEKQDKEIGTSFQLNDINQCTCDVRHVSLRHLLYSSRGTDEELGSRATRIKTKFWIANQEQRDLFAAAHILIEEMKDKGLLPSPTLTTKCMRKPGQFVSP